MKKFLGIVFLGFFYQSLSFSEIKDPRIWNNVYSGCTAEYNSNTQMTKKEFDKYCTCAADDVVKKFSVKELVLLEQDLYSASEEDQLKIAFANKKMKNIIAECISRVIN